MASSKAQRSCINLCRISCSRGEYSNYHKAWMCICIEVINRGRRFKGGLAVEARPNLTPQGRLDPWQKDLLIV
jgi:hypothetical protein